MRRTFHLIEVENDQNITAETDALFYYEYQKALLFALQEADILNDRQLQDAERKLTEEFKKSPRNGGGNSCVSE